jgi:hypothetical protein
LRREIASIGVLRKLQKQRETMPNGCLIVA